MRRWWPLPGAVGAGVLGVVAVAVAGWGLTGHRPEQLAGWIEAVATLWAFAAAAVAAWYAAGTFGRETHERRQRQAALVAAWDGMRELDPARKAERSQIPLLKYLPMTESGAYLRNASQLPVTDVWLTVRLAVRDQRTEALRLFPVQHVPMPVLPPREEPTFQPYDSVALHDAFSAAGSWLNPEVQVAITFRDAAGNRWRRDFDGVLVEAT